MQNRSTVVMVRAAFLGGLGGLLMLFEFPLLPAADFLKYDAGDVPALIGGFMMGPWVGLLIQAIKTAIFAISGKNVTGIIGLAASFAAGAALVVPASLLFHSLGRNMRAAVIGMVAATFSLTATMVALNYWVFFPLWGITSGLGALLVQVAIPFNLLKGLLTSVITLVLWARLKTWAVSKVATT